MKRFALFLSVLFLFEAAVQAKTTTNLGSSSTSNTYVNGYNGNAFIFVENGIEFSIFPDGQFDFYMQNYGPNVSIGMHSPNVSISYNKGYDYSAYVQYDNFGAIIQIENVPIYYDYYGRISQAGNVNISYNSYGRIARIGGLYIHYNRYNRYSHCSGYINHWNRYYVYRPWHQYYIVPSINFCVVFNRPYRQYYKPIRYAYTQPYYNNYRRNTAVYSRRGNHIVPSRRYATSRGNRALASHPPRRVSKDLAINTPPRKGNNRTVSPRSNNVRSRANNGAIKPRTNSSKSKGATIGTPTPRTNNGINPRSSSTKPRVNSVNTPRYRSNSSMKPRSNSPQQRIRASKGNSPKRTVKRQTTTRPSAPNRPSRKSNSLRARRI